METAPFSLEKRLPTGFPPPRSFRQLTSGPGHHFCGYYGISPWNASGSRLFCLRTGFGARLPEAGDRADICLIDCESGTLSKMEETSAWNFQQGALIHWLGTDPDRKIIYNDRDGAGLRAVVLDVESGERTFLPRPIGAVSPSGRLAACINYSRLRDTRPGYGYAGSPDPFAGENHPEGDGIWVMDTATGDARLAVSLDQVYRSQPEPEGLESGKLWFNHVLFNPGETRIFFLARFLLKDGALATSVYTIGVDGSDLRCLAPYGPYAGSHYDWLDDRRLVVTGNYQGARRHVLYTDGEGEAEVLRPDFLDFDGHAHFSPDRRWMVTDSYRRADGYRSLYLMNWETREIATVGRFFEPEEYTSHWRCDLHPRWRGDSRALCIDSSHTGTRQVYVLEFGQG